MKTCNERKKERKKERSYGNINKRNEAGRKKNKEDKIKCIKARNNIYMNK